VTAKRWLSLLVLLALCACRREERRFSEPPELRARSTVASRPAADKVAGFVDNAWSISEGQRLFLWFNCAGCHGLGGGGGMGPALRDGGWRYGGSPESIHRSILEGRSNGMPAFGSLVPDYQIWQLTAYVHALSGRARQDAAPGRSDSIALGQPPVMSPRREPFTESR
jgi:cytochrome c oxidase cbb3-type subunit 3